MISVIIPTYKEPDYLDLCLQSAIENQNEQNEIIVVIDGFYDLNKSVLDKYSDKINVLDLGENQGLSVATNWGVYNASNDYVLIVNDDNIFPKDWDTQLKKDLNKGIVLTANQIEPNPSFFQQFIIKNFGHTPEEFNLEIFTKEEINLRQDKIEQTGSTLPFAMYREDYLAVGGWDIMYPSPHVVDWDFFLKCEYWGLKMLRTYKCNFYHFAGAATRKTPEQSLESTKKEQNAHLFFQNKWKQPAQHNQLTNSKKLLK